MGIALALTDAQRTVIWALAERVAGGDLDALAAAAVAHDRAARPEPRWAGIRPAGRPPSPHDPSARLDATLPAATGAVLRLAPGHRLRIEQLAGGQGVDVRMLAAGGPPLSAARTRAAHGIAPSVGAVLWSQVPERPLAAIVADTCPGHDLLWPSCSEREYARHTGLTGHRGCAELGAAALAVAGCEPADDDGDVLNLWLPSAVGPDGRLRSWPTRCRAGDHVELAIGAAVTVALTTCPDDMYGTSQYAPKPVRVIVTGGSAGAIATPGWPTDSPDSARARQTLTVSPDDGDLEWIDAWAARGWRGDDRASVMRALLLALHESLAGDHEPPPRQSAA